MNWVDWLYILSFMLAVPLLVWAGRKLGPRLRARLRPQSQSRTIKRQALSPSTLSGFTKAIRDEFSDMRHRLRINQPSYDPDLYVQTGEALDHSAKIYLPVPYRALVIQVIFWFIPFIKVRSRYMTRWVLFQDCWFCIETDQFHADQRLFDTWGPRFFHTKLANLADMSIVDIADEGGASLLDFSSWLLELMGVRLLEVQIAFREEPYIIPVLVRGLRWPDRPDDPDSKMLSSEESLLMMLRYAHDQVMAQGSGT